VNKPKAVIFDVDGTLVDVSSIRHFVDRTDPNFSGKRQFDRFHKESINCPAHDHVVEAFRKAKAEGLVCIVATGRSERFRQLTKWWLTNHGVFPEHQLHRADNDFRVDIEVKRDMLNGLREHYEIIETWDDNPHVIKLWESEGLKVNVVPGWPVRDGEAVATTSEKEFASDGA